MRRRAGAPPVSPRPPGRDVRVQLWLRRLLPRSWPAAPGWGPLRAAPAARRAGSPRRRAGEGRGCREPPPFSAAAAAAAQQPGPTPSPTHPAPCSQPRSLVRTPSPPRHTPSPPPHTHTHTHSPPAAPHSLTLPFTSLTCLACARSAVSTPSHSARDAGGRPARSLRPKRRAPPARVLRTRAHPAPPSGAAAARPRAGGGGRRARS